MYYAEKPVQPEEFSSIPAAIWWAVCTLTTVGYGDVVPKTEIGRLLASVISVWGSSLFRQKSWRPALATT
jgi:voltage-gated potassium channel